MDFRGYLQKGFEIVKLNRQAAVEASKDETALMPENNRGRVRSSGV